MIHIDRFCLPSCFRSVDVFYSEERKKKSGHKKINY